MTEPVSGDRHEERRPRARRATPAKGVIRSLQERAKELNCLYQVEEILSKPDLPLETSLMLVIEALPEGLQYPERSQALIRLDGREYRSRGYSATPWRVTVPLRRGGEVVGEIEVSYSQELPQADSGPFLREEVRLFNAIADRLGAYLERPTPGPASEQWKSAINLLREADHDLYVRVARRMIRHLYWVNVEDAREVLERTGHRQVAGGAADAVSENRPEQITTWDDTYYLTNEPFELAARHMSGDEILHLVQTWMAEERSSLLSKIVNNRQTSIMDITRALRRYKEQTPDESRLPAAAQKGIVVSLIRRFLGEDLAFIGKAKKNLKATDFLEITEKTVYARETRGRIGGKSTGLFLAGRILEPNQSLLQGDFEIKVPNSWYLASESIVEFMEYNDLHDWTLEQKYKDLDRVRREYPILVQLFKHARFPPDLITGLSMALDDFQNSPIIARSSSLGEDRQGTAFSGKYKSLFLANQGSKKARLNALLDAITEIYASMFSPDPIEYRRERGLLDFDEEMGILLQEVVGARVGRYYFPTFSGVAFSNNEFSWSPRIARSDGLLRLVPGLGTRAVDRVGDDYPVLIAIGKPGLRANASLDEKMRYAPRMIDVMDLEAGSFKTLPLDELLKEEDLSYPDLRLVFSTLQRDRLVPPSPVLADPRREKMVATFEGLLGSTTFVKQVSTLMRLLEEGLETAVDVEFACEGRNLYVLQCRAQSYAANEAPALIPSDIAEPDVLFRGRRHISNGTLPDIRYVVYVDPFAYARLESLAELKAVGEAVGRLNQTLPHRRFILMGPGRWGSRGDIKLGVSITYSDINNTAMLVEIAHRKAGYSPDLSFGTHFFQDLVESSIRYLPLYPDEEEGMLNERLLLEAPNHLAAFAPAFAGLEDVVRVVDMAEVTGGGRLQVAMNGEAEEALGYLVRG